MSVILFHWWQPSGRSQDSSQAAEVPSVLGLDRPGRDLPIPSQPHEKSARSDLLCNVSVEFETLAHIEEYIQNIWSLAPLTCASTLTVIYWKVATLQSAVAQKELVILQLRLKGNP